MADEHRAPAYREIEDGVATDLAGQTTYASYLRLDLLLDAQQPVSDHHDEMLFIVTHHVMELWLKQLVHELRSALDLLAADELAPALKRLARIKHIQRQMADAWSVLATLTPVEYLRFRDRLGRASGFQSPQYRSVEFLLGNKTPAMLAVFRHDPTAYAVLEADLARPSLYDEFLRLLARRGHDLPADVVERDWREPYVPSAGVERALGLIYADTDAFWEEYEACEELVDVEEGFQLWRFRHLKTVERIIGRRTGTGGSSGVDFLRRALDLTFFPELLDVRSTLTP